MIEIVWALIWIDPTPRAASHGHGLHVRYYETLLSCEYHASLLPQDVGRICIATVDPEVSHE